VLTLALPQIQAGLAIPEADIGRVVAVIRLGVLPALLLAALADRVGRRRLLLVTIGGFTAATLATAFAPSATAFTICQFLARIFIAAEEMLAIVVITEELGAETRGFGLGVLGAFGALGFGVAAIVLAFIARLPFGWRALYVVGAVPLVWVTWLRRGLPETRRFAEEKQRRGPEAGLAGVLRPFRELVVAYPGRMLFLVGSLLAAALIGHTALTFVSKFLQDTHGYSPGQLTLLFLFAGFVVYFGTASAGVLADRFGRRRVIAVALVLNAIGVFFFYRSSGVVIILAWIVMNACWVGSEVLFGALGSELFPTSYRSTASGVRAAAATVGGSIGLWVEAQLYPLAGSHASAITWLLGLAWIAPLLILVSLPETARRELEEIAGGSA